MAMRIIEVSTDVYAAIWADRKPGEDSENSILARKYKVEEILSSKPVRRQGWVDTRNGVTLWAGEEIFRTYKGKEFRAKAQDGFLILTNGVKCNSLNQLSRTIGAGIENAWQNWYITGADGKRELIMSRRNN